MNKKQALLRVGMILDKCRECPLNDVTKKENCNGCVEMLDLIELRNYLDAKIIRKKNLKPVSITIEQYCRKRSENMIDAQIADFYNTTLPLLKKWKRKNGEELAKRGYYQKRECV